MKKNNLGISGDSALARTMSGSNEWHTPPEHIRLVKRVLGCIELDPASCEEANQIVQAQRYYTASQDGLRQSWRAKTLFLNPPYGRGQDHRSNQDLWSCKLIEEYENGHVAEAILLINASTGTEWFQRLVWRGYLMCLVKGRIRFYGRGKSELGPTHDNVFVYFGSKNEQFITVFGQVGALVKSISPMKEFAQLWNSAHSAS